MFCGEDGSSAPTVMGFSGSLAKRGENDFTCATRAFTWSAARNGFHDGIEVPCIPLVMLAARSSSVGRPPVSVDLNLYRPLVKSRGRGSRSEANCQSPCPDFP